jgi:hypothetical protein
MRSILLPLLAGLLFIVSLANAQDSRETDAKGIGVNREDALQDALRNAVSAAAGVAVVAETSMENFVVVRDAVATKSSGYVEGYTILSEKAGANYEMNIKAKVNLNPLKADITLLSRAIGGVRFLVMFDDRGAIAEDAGFLDFAAERINAALADRKYRYIERSRFQTLRREASNMMQASDTSELTYVQQLGLMADAQFIIFLKAISTEIRLEAFDTRKSTRVLLEAKAYDNCTGEGLGTILMTSNWQSNNDITIGKRAGLEEAVTKDMDKLLKVFNSYIGDWVNNGTPFELRFYQTGTFRDFRDLRTKLRADSDFGGQLEITSVNNFTKLNCTFKKTADAMADKILDYSDEIPSFREKRLDVKLIYGRQLSFAPQSVIVPSLRSPNQKNTETPQQSPPSQVQPASPSKTSGTAKPTTPAKKPSPKPQTPGKK